MITNTRTLPASPRRLVPAASLHASVSPRSLASRSSLGDPRFDRITTRPRRGLWDHALLDRLQSPLTRYHD